MNRSDKHNILFIYLTIFLILTFGAFLWQFFLPDIAAKYSVWNTSRGWQREIALWNAGIDIAIVMTLIRKNIEYAKILAFMGTSLCLLLGGNHLISAVTSEDNTTLHWLGTAEVLVFGTGFGLITLFKSGFFTEFKIQMDKSR